MRPNVLGDMNYETGIVSSSSAGSHAQWLLAKGSLTRGSGAAHPNSTQSSGDDAADACTWSYTASNSHENVCNSSHGHIFVVPETLVGALHLNVKVEPGNGRGYKSTVRAELEVGC